MAVGDLAMLSDCRTAALVTLDGAVVWWPGPRFDGPSVFSRLLDPDGDELDAAVLLLPLVGLLEAGDERMRRTLAVVDEVLGEGGLHRRLEGRDDEGAFLLVTFWMAACLAKAGEVDAARAAFERPAGCANDVGLLAEMADPRSGEPRGNVPQALSHVGLIYAAQCLTEAREASASSSSGAPA